MQALSPKDDTQRLLQVQALNITLEHLRARWLMYEEGSESVSVPMLAIVVFWLATIFLSFGLFAPGRVTVITALFLAALSVSAAIFLIVEMYAPFGGLIKISSAPLRAGLGNLGQ
jgi:membrane-bound ClpP family serine protease